MTKALIILNPAAGTKARGMQELAAAIARAGGGQAEVAITQRAGHATELAQRGAQSGQEMVVAVGGDGTVHEVVNGLMGVAQEQRPALAVVALGSGNDFAYACGQQRLGTRDVVGAVQRLVEGKELKVRRIDVAHIRAGERSAYFGNSAGMLFDAAINMHSHHTPGIPGLPRMSRYFVAMARAFLQNYTPVRMEMEIDGVVQTRPLILLTLANGPREGGAFYCTPTADHADGELDYLMAAPMARWRMLKLLPGLMRGTHVRSPRVTLGRFRRMVIRAEGPMPIHLDGELWARPEDGVREIEVQIMPAALRVRL